MAYENLIKTIQRLNPIAPIYLQDELINVGVTKKELFAGMAMMALLQTGDNGDNIAGLACYYAELLEEELNKDGVQDIIEES